MSAIRSISQWSTTICLAPLADKLASEGEIANNIIKGICGVDEIRESEHRLNREILSDIRYIDKGLDAEL